MSDETRTPQEILAALAAPFEVADVEWRIDGKAVDGDRGRRARCVCYVKARAVMDRLDAVLPPLAWSTEYTVLPDGKHVECRLTLALDGTGAVSRCDVGETNEGGFADGMKSAYSDALKRAAVQFGIGRYLGKILSEWADVEARGKNDYITDRALAGLERTYCERTGVANPAAAKPARPDAEVAVQAQGARQAAKSDKASAGDISVWWGHVQKLGFTRQQVQAILNERKLVLAGLTKPELNDVYRQLVELSKQPAAGTAA